MNGPTMHKPVPMNSRVRIPTEYLGYPTTGTVVGIGAMHVIFLYIVLLDKPHASEHGEIRAMTVGGSQLESEDGLTNWRLSPDERL